MIRLLPAPTDTTVTVDHSRRVVRPNHADADDYYGLALGTNGTAATARRETAAPAGYTWRRHDGAQPTSLRLRPARESAFVNPWTHEMERTP